MNIANDPIAAFCHALMRWPDVRGIAKIAEDRAPTACRLGKGQTFGMPCAFGSSIECLAGKLWITHDGDPKDIALAAGQCYIVDRRSKLLVHALSDSVFRQSGASCSGTASPARQRGSAASPNLNCR